LSSEANRPRSGRREVIVESRKETAEIDAERRRGHSHAGEAMIFSARRGFCAARRFGSISALPRTNMLIDAD
jgi:hypothetical protein